MEEVLIPWDGRQNKEMLKYIDPKEGERLLVVGDIHGDPSYERILDMFDNKNDILIFLGDYADRGPEGVEAITSIYNLMNLYPERVVALKGNHEDYSIICVDEKSSVIPYFSPCTLIDEVKEKFEKESDFWCKIFEPFINKTYLSAIIPGEILFVHGGISSKIESIEDLKHPNEKVEEDILWSDPFDGYGEKPNPRDAGVLFGKDVTDSVCQKLNVKGIIRGHEPRKAIDGPYVEHGGKVITVSSTSVYGGKPFLLEVPTEEIDNVFENPKRYTLYLK